MLPIPLKNNIVSLHCTGVETLEESRKLLVSKKCLLSCEEFRVIERLCVITNIFMYEFLPRKAFSILKNCISCETPTKEPDELGVINNFHP